MQERERTQVDENFMAQLTRKACLSERGRAAHSFSKPGDSVQEIINTLEPLSYMQPHKHSTKGETRFILAGRVAVVIFDDNGEIKETRILNKDEDLLTTVVEPGIWHMLVSLQEGSAIRAIINGPYREETHKEAAPFAPSEDNHEQGQAYLAEIKEKISSAAR